MRSPELRHRVVAVLAEHLGVETLRAGKPGGRGPVLAARDLVEKLVEEQPPHRFRRPRVAGEQRPLDHFGQVGQHEDGAVDVSKVGCERIDLCRSECIEVRSGLWHTV